eukprot:TRINITY_DN85378_c0_g1_i1.p1 TRINITY_DN85378_c0_g1~~TRINITY_DN85378_c0_g1_i1.p1  ORF type:complete len:368 (-),score=105.85 TRINITY_DN85378_c0_g1_i1:26-1129(-)
MATAAKAGGGATARSRLFGSAVGTLNKPERERRVSTGAKAAAKTSAAPRAEPAREEVPAPVAETPAATPAAASAGGARGRGNRVFGGGIGSSGGTSQALDGGGPARGGGFGGDEVRGGGGNSRASAFARAFGVEESEYKPLRRGRRGRAGPYGEEDEIDESMDYNGFPRYSRFDWDEPEWEHDQFKGPQTIGSAIFIRNLPPGIESYQLHHLFEEAGQIAKIQVDNGPLPSATVGYVRQDVAFDAEELFNGRYLRGHELKVTIKANEVAGGALNDDEFWRKELKDMRRSGMMIPNIDEDDWWGKGYGKGRKGGWGDSWSDSWSGKGGGGKGRKGKGRSGGGGGYGPDRGRDRGRGGGGGMASALAWD